MRKWRRKSSGTIAPATEGVVVLDVTPGAGSTAIWTFSADPTDVGILDDTQITGRLATLYALGPGVDQITGTYDSAPVSGDAWSNVADSTPGLFVPDLPLLAGSGVLT